MAQLSPIYIIGMGTALVLLYQSVKLARAGKENVLEFLLWTSFGGGLLLYTLARVIAKPRVIREIDSVLTSLGFESGERGLLVLSIISLYLIVLYSYTLTKTNEKRISDLQQELALLQFELQELRESDGDGSPSAHDETEASPNPPSRPERRAIGDGTPSSQPGETMHASSPEQTRSGTDEDSTIEAPDEGAVKFGSTAGDE